MTHRLTPAERQAIRERAEAATAGPWYVRYTDDASFMCMTVICTTDYGDGHDNKRFDNEPDVVAITLHQLMPRVGLGSDDCGDADSAFIAHARTDIPRLLNDLDAAEAEVERLQFLLWEAEQSLRDVTAQHADEIEDDDMMAWNDLADRIDAALPQGEGTDGQS